MTSYLKLTIKVLSFTINMNRRHSLNVLGNIILLCVVHYNYNELCGGLLSFVALHIPLILGVKVLHTYLHASCIIILCAYIDIMYIIINVVGNNGKILI